VANSLSWVPIFFGPTTTPSNLIPKGNPSQISNFLKQQGLTWKCQSLQDPAYVNSIDVYNNNEVGFYT